MPACESVPNTATPVAFTPPAGAGEKVTVGGIVYPEPGLLIFAELTSNVAVAVAVVPPAGGGLIMIAGSLI